VLERFVESFILKSRAKQNELTARMRCGGLKDFVEYKLVAGRIKGLEDSDEIVRSLYRMTMEGIENKECEIKDVEPKYF
jgi:hypothetical protein